MALQKFQSRYSGEEIDRILQEVEGKISFEDIVDDYSGGTDKVASAESVRLIKLWMNQFDDPEWLKNLFLTIPGSSIFTLDDREVLERLKNGFQGTYDDDTDRAVNLITTDFIGGEVSLLLNANGGIQSLDYWDDLTDSWIPCNFSKSMYSDDIDVTTGGTHVVLQVNRFQVNTIKFIMRTQTAVDICTIEVTGVVFGNDTFWTSQGYIGTNQELITLNRFYIDGDFAKFEFQLPSNSKTNFYKVAEF